ncbi:MAG: nucleotidyltransferase domain-containing protein [archaeon GBS-70-058]|nr:nucleotidyltransferase domain-containing protein [Candidatus Culexarchaeum nevadense]
MYRYLDYLKRSKEDLEENFGKYLEILNGIAKKYGGKAYMFGSYVKGEYISASDIDILIEIPNNIDRFIVLHEARRLVQNRRVEIHVLNESDAKIFKELIKVYKEIK